MLGIIGAQIEEIQAIKKAMKNVSEVNYHGSVYYQGQLCNQNVVLALCGIGKVAAARSTVLLIDNFEIDSIINVGTSGGVKNKVQKRQVVVAEKLAYSDVDLTFFKHYQYGQMAACPAFFESDEIMVNRMLNSGTFFVKGTLLAGDAFVSDGKKVEQLIDTYFPNDNVCAFDMESTAIAQVCYLSAKKFIVLRYISDIIGEESQDDNYETNLLYSSASLAEIIQNYLLAED